MWKRQRTGSVVCSSCGSLVGVNDERCYTCGRRNPGLWGFAPAVRSLGSDLGFVTFVLGACIILYVTTLVMSGTGIGMQGLMSLLAPSRESLLVFGASGAVPVFSDGRWWTVASASWLHGSFLHILFNMLWVRQLGPATAEVYGAARMVIIYTVAGICGFILSSLAGHYLVRMPIPFLRGAQFTIGASASIFGLLGAMVYYGRRGGSSAVRSEAIRYAAVLFVFGLFMPGIDNYAHAGGFAGGYIVARWLDPLRPERIDHVVGALLCLGLSALAILVSVLTPRPLAREIIQPSVLGGIHEDKDAGSRRTGDLADAAGDGSGSAQRAHAGTSVPDAQPGIYGRPNAQGSQCSRAAVARDIKF